jgi:hypothetical protein
MAIAKANPQKRRRLNLLTLKQDNVKVLWVRAYINLPFRLVKYTEFYVFLIYLNTDVKYILAKSYIVVRKWVVRQYKGIKKWFLLIYLALNQRFISLLIFRLF